jgi:hypothetical protein
MKTENLLNLKLDSTNEEVRTALLRLCANNRNLKNFINKVFRENKDKQICAWEDYGWEWDVECNGSDEGAEIAICNHDLRDDKHYEGNGWEIYNAPKVFGNYFSNFNWDDIKLDDGKFLLLIDEEDYLSFQIFDGEKMEDGMVDVHGILWN